MEYTFNESETTAIDSFKTFCEWHTEQGETDLESLDWFALSAGFFLRELGAIGLGGGTIERALQLAAYVRYKKGYWQ